MSRDRHRPGDSRSPGLGGVVRSVLRPLGRAHDHGHAHGRGHGHHHSHSHSHGRGLAGHAEDTSQVGIRALAVSLVGLGVTAVLQLAIVVLSGSVALLADTIHNFADALTAVPLWCAFVIGRRPPTRRYTYGFGRAEDLAGVFIVLVIAVSAAVAGYEAVHRLLHPREVTDLGWVIAAGVVGFAGNELAALHRLRVGRRIGSAALVADGLHARTDGLTSLAVVLGGIGTAAGIERADPLVGLLITVMILGVLRGAARDIYHRLMDGVDPALVERIERTLGQVAGVDRVDSVRVRWVGHRLHAEAEIVSAPSLSLAEAHDIAETARHELLHAEPRLHQALLHTSPGTEGVDPHARVAHHATLPAPAPSG